MKNNILKGIKILAVMAMFILVGCEKEETNKQEVKKGFAGGMYISCEGPMGGNIGSISYFNPDSNILVNKVYEIANEEESVGDVVQSFGIAGKRGVIVVNGSGNVIIVNLESFKQLGSITIESPRYFVSSDSTKGFVTSGKSNGTVVVINPVTASVINKIPVGIGPNKITIYKDKLYVLNSAWYGGKDSTISVINIKTLAVESTIKLSAYNPSDIEFDANGNMWVVCKGYNDYMSISTSSKLIKLNSNNYTEINSWVIGNTTDWAIPTNLCLSTDKKTIYFDEAGGIFAMGIGATSVPSTAVISKSYYGFEVNPKNNDIYCFDAANYVSNGKMIIYNSAGSLKAEYAVGIIPNGAAFNF